VTDNANPKLTEYYREAATWSRDLSRSRLASQRLAWIIAGVASTIAIFEAIALVALTPLKTAVPYTLLVDRQTGFVQALKPLDQETVAPDAALTRSLVAQYVIAREGFDIDSLRDDYRKVALWSTGEARTHYVQGMQASNPASPLSTLPRQALVQVQIRGISSLNADTSLVRFATVRTDLGGQGQEPQLWSAVIRYRFSGAAMSAADRLTNPLGFQVQRYRRDAELPLPAAQAAPQDPASTQQQRRIDPRAPTQAPNIP
jgi:type IV secretion system protein VirB8